MSQVQVKTRADIFAAPSDVSESPLSAAAAAAVVGVVQQAGFAGEGGVTLPATTSAVGTVRLADPAAITAGTAGRVVDAAQLKAAADAKQPTLVSGTNVKTINGTSILGGGDIVVSGGGGGSVTINTTLTSASTTEAASASTVKTLQDTKAPRGGPGAALGATYTAVEADDGKIWPTPVDCAVTVNTGLLAGFGQGFTGAGVVSFVAGAGVTFPADYDKRTAGAANPVCSLVNIGLNTYEIWGTKQ